MTIFLLTGMALFSWMLQPIDNPPIRPEIYLTPKEQSIQEYAHEQCMKRVWTESWWRWCRNMMATIKWESWRRPFVISRTNDYWLFQLHYKYHKTFIKSKAYLNQRKQIDYWISVRLDAKKKNRKCNWYAHPLCK